MAWASPPSSTHAPTWAILCNSCVVNSFRTNAGFIYIHLSKQQQARQRVRSAAPHVKRCCLDTFSAATDGTMTPAAEQEDNSCLVDDEHTIATPLQLVMPFVMDGWMYYTGLARQSTDRKALYEANARNGHATPVHITVQTQHSSRTPRHISTHAVFDPVHICCRDAPSPGQRSALPGGGAITHKQHQLPR
jgi:hypothetical protein